MTILESVYRLYEVIGNGHCSRKQFNHQIEVNHLFQAVLHDDPRITYFKMMCRKKLCSREHWTYGVVLRSECMHFGNIPGGEVEVTGALIAGDERRELDLGECEVLDGFGTMERKVGSRFQMIVKGYKAIGLIRKDCSNPRVRIRLITIS
jgi:hypothetical protein